MGDRPRSTVLVAHPSADDGRSDHVLLHTVDGLRDDGWRVVAALPNEGPLASRLRSRSVRVETIPAPVLRRRDLGVRGVARFGARTLASSGRIRGLLKRADPDVVVVSTMTQPEWVLAARLQRIPVLVHVQELGTTAPLLIREAIAWPISIADRVIVDSTATRDALLRVQPALGSKVAVLPTAVVGPRVVEPPRDALIDGLRICCVARVEPGAGLRTVIDAVHLLLADGVAVRLEIAPLTIDPAAIDRLRRRVADLGVEDAVRIRAVEAAPWDALRYADVAIVPSRPETSSTGTAIEALLSARPVVVTTSRGMADTAEGFASAIPVDDRDPEELARALRRIVASWSAFRRSAVALAPVAKHRFSPDVYRAAVASEVRALAPEGRRTRRSIAA